MGVESLQVEASLGVHLHQPSGHHHYMLNVRLGVVFGHSGALILMQAANGAERTRHNGSRTRAGHRIQMSVHLLACDVRLATRGTIGREFGTLAQMMSRQVNEQDSGVAQLTLAHAFGTLDLEMQGQVATRE
jgi:hypothetical protein